MRYKKNFVIIVINILLILFILLLSIPAYKYLSKDKVDDNEFVKGQVIINPESKSPTILDRTLNIKFIAKVDHHIFSRMQDNCKK